MKSVSSPRIVAQTLPPRSLTGPWIHHAPRRGRACIDRDHARGRGTLALRGRMVRSFPQGAGCGHALRLSADNAGYADTGFACRVDARGLVVTAPPPGVTVIGGYPFHLNRVDELIAEIDRNATIVALPDRSRSAFRRESRGAGPTCSPN